MTDPYALLSRIDAPSVRIRGAAEVESTDVVYGEIADQRVVVR
jgi:hypothetical protein